MTVSISKVRDAWIAFHDQLIQQLNTEYTEYINRLLAIKQDTISQIDDIYQKHLLLLNNLINNTKIAIPETCTNSIIGESAFNPKHEEEQKTDLDSTTSTESICKYCHLSFQSLSSLKIHSLIHQTNHCHPYLCSICHARFTNHTDLIMHEMTHELCSKNLNKP